ncbi:MAG: beta-galactosidase, partial [Bacteroidota bacterium]
MVYLSAATLSFAQMPTAIFVGTVYNIFHEEFATDEEFFKQVDRDIALMKESNITHVMIFPMSQWDPDTKQLLWTRTDYLVKKIEDSHMKFVPLMLKEEQCSHYFPMWKFKEIPGLWEEYNVDNGNKNNRENVDFADPRVYPLVEEYFKAVIERYGKSPALSFYNIWNEPHYQSTSGHVIERFRKWVHDKYTTLPALRRAWGKEYSDWSEVSPFLNDNWNSSMPQIDWIMFRNELNGELLAQLVHTLRKYDTIHPVNANPVGTLWANFNNYGAYNIDNVPIADHDDIDGISYYPDGWERDHNLEPCPFWLHNLTFNTIRSASGKKNYILTELYTNAQNGLALNGYLDSNFVEDLAWTALANDCKGIIYWKWLPFMRGRQSLGRGLTHVDGELAPRGGAVKDVASVMKKYGETLYRAHLKRAQVAVLVDMVGLLKTLEQTTEPLTNKIMFESNAGLFKALYENNITVDMVRMDRNLDLQMLKAYKIIYLPFQIVMRRGVADMLKAYVRQGGWVVADARTATLDEFDFAYRTSPGAGLDELFGAVRPDWTGQKKYFNVKINGENGRPAFEFEGKYFRDELRLTGHAKVLGSFEDTGEPAVIQNHYGNGMAVLSAVPLGASYYGNPENAVHQLLFNLTQEAGVSPDAIFHSDNNAFLNIKVHAIDSALVVYIINSENRSASGRVEITVSGKKIQRIKDIISEQDIPFEQKEEKLSIPLEVRENQV